MPDTLCVALDTNILVAGVSTWHERHAIAYRLVAQLLGEVTAPRIVIPRMVLLEAYSVLTRLPAPHRMSPEVALQVLSETFRERVEVVDRSSSDAWTLLQSAWKRNVAGGAIHDAAILDAAEAAGATRLYTFNLRHFERLGSRRVEILSP